MLNVISAGEFLALPLLILDLDETLIFATETALSHPYDFEFAGFKVYKRPGVDQFIQAVSGWYSLAVWTSSTSDYAECIADRLFGDVPLEFLWSRERCTRRFDHENQEPYWVKDLKKVRRLGFELGRVIVVDDTPRKLERSYGNVVYVGEFAGDSTDGELMLLEKYLRKIANEPDFRAIEKRGWRKEI